MYVLENFKRLAVSAFVNSFRSDAQSNFLGHFDGKKLFKCCFTDSTGTYSLKGNILTLFSFVLLAALASYFASENLPVASPCVMLLSSERS